MELLPLLLACSLLFAVVAPARDITDACASQINDFQQLNSSGLYLTLHHPQSPCSPAPLPSDLPFSTVLTHDDARVTHLASRLAAAVPCSAPQCDELPAATLNPSACSVSNVCVYQASYGDQSFSVGYLSKDTVSFGSAGQKFPGFYYGCGQDNEGLFGRSAGLIGLARNKLSLLYQLAPNLGSYSFAYCLPTSSSSGYLTIGSYNPGQYSFTPMASGSSDDSLYFVSLAGMSVAGSPLPVASSEYGSLPTIVDSGTVITRLPTTVYAALSQAVAAAMAGTPRAEAYSILDTCFQGQASRLRVPAVTMAFAGGATVRLAARNVLIDVDDATTCLAFAATDSTAIIGNTQQQTFSVVYDVAQSRIGFAPGGCS
ncbi:hypothetical protein PR202_ga17096 [Eleusine coracana subsp. coracana]|uniref:Peptidase A1 domain-containing protein n=1 Tax=Eleusine coracana subsp. coracana TaxID=191504 RepID=A0AAV5CN43_ELECO|nr:hypothetical protein QOZ80_6AG0518480 [Eleusine coracana subsp. coracana]GJM99953.1 hypothetical protein PR202_ga17096 [Eleusine coracana subsp. coracana]